MADHVSTTAELYIETTMRLRSAFEHAHERGAKELTDALNAVCTEAHFRRLSPQAIELAMRMSWADVRRPRDVDEAAWTEAYFAALGRCLTSYFATPR